MAKSRSIGSIYAELTLKDKMSKGIASARKSLNTLGTKSLKAAALGTVALGAAMAVGTKRTLGMTDELVDVSNQTGVAVDDMMKLQLAYADGGRAAENTGKDIAKMQKAIVAAAQGGKDPFAVMGLSAQELLAMDPADQFNTIGEAIMRIANPAERTAKAMEIFGKGGMGLTTVFGGLKNAEKALGRMPELAKKFGAAMGEANDLIGHLPLKSDQFFMGFTAGIIGELLPGLKKIDDYDFTTVGENLGSALSVAFQVVTDGTVWEIFALHAEKAIAGIQTSPAFNGFAAHLNTIFDGITSSYKDNFNYDEAFNKYAGAGVEANTEIIDDLQAKIDELNNRTRAKFESKRSAAAELSGPPAPIANPIETTPELPPYQAEIPTGTPADNMVNEYQRRGLSLDGTTNANEDKTKETNSLLKEIRDAIKNPKPRKPVF
jgi:hypothetical protein